LGYKISAQKNTVDYYSYAGEHTGTTTPMGNPFTSIHGSQLPKLNTSAREVLLLLFYV